MKRQYKLTVLTAVLFCLVSLLNGCTRDNEILIPETSIDQSPADYSATIGEEVTFTGKNMHLISKIAFDDQTVNVTTLPADRSQTSLTVILPDDFEVTKNITVFATYNSTRKLVLSESFEVVVPPIRTEAASATIGDKIILNGKNMHLVTKVSFGDQVVSFDRNPDRSHITLTVTVPSTFGATQTVPLTVTYATHTVEVRNNFEVIVPPVAPDPVLPYFFWEEIEMGCHGTEKAFFDVVNGRTLSPCDLAAHPTDVTFAMDNTSSITTARLLNPANIGTNLTNAQFCNGIAINLNDFTIWKDPTQATPFKKVTDNTLIDKVKNGEINDILEDIGAINPADIKTNTPTIAQGEVYYFYHKEKFGLLWIKTLEINGDRKLNTVALNVYYEK